MQNFFDSKYYYPSNFLISTSSENFNVISPDTKITFGGEIIFNLANSKNENGDCIEDLILCIDIPILNPTDNIEYVDNIEYIILENLFVLYGPNNKNTNNPNKIIFQTNGTALYLHPLIYAKNYEEYHSINKIENKKMIIIYKDQPINIHRIVLPLFLFKSSQNHLPIKKINNNDMFCKLILKVASLEKICKGRIKQIDLLNVFLLANYINLSSVNKQINHQTNSKTVSKIIDVPINQELKKLPIMYLFNKLNNIIMPINKSSNTYFEETLIPLNKFGYIKDIFFILLEKSDFEKNRIDKFSDKLVEIEIYSVVSKDGASNKLLHTKLDSTMLNQYIPLKKLGHTLPTGFTTTASVLTRNLNQILGGFDGNSSYVLIRTLKIDGYIKFYSHQYITEII